MEEAQSCVYGGLDDATAKLIIQLHDSDVQEYLRSSKGKGRHDQISDIGLAMEIYEQDLKETSILLTDRSMSQSITRAVITDAAVLKDCYAEEDVAVKDRALAHRLVGLDPPSARPNRGETSDCGIDAGIVSRLGALYVPCPIDEGLAPAESSAWAASSPKRSAVTLRECASCNSSSPLAESFQAPCGHQYCLECLHTLFEMSTKDETLFPPRCCRQRIPVLSAKLYLRATSMEEFEKKALEFKSSDRLYCSQPRCSMFIASVNTLGDRAECTACGSTICTVCKGIAHHGDCPEDTGLRQTLKTAQEQGWQRCNKCRRLVELDIGCNHITYYLLVQYVILSVLT